MSATILATLGVVNAFRKAFRKSDYNNSRPPPLTPFGAGAGGHIAPTVVYSWPHPRCWNYVPSVITAPPLEVYGPDSLIACILESRPMISENKNLDTQLA